jgi:hypothetical protein
MAITHFSSFVFQVTLVHLSYCATSITFPSILIFLSLFQRDTLKNTLVLSFPGSLRGHS